jgi:hypothetical protein
LRLVKVRIVSSSRDVGRAIQAIRVSAVFSKDWIELRFHVSAGDDCHAPKQLKQIT